MDRDELVIPEHIAIIMDGNGRWAKERGKIRLEGHRAGANSLEKILKYAGDIGVNYLADCEKIVFNIAFNYGGRREIIDAVNKVLHTKLSSESNVIVKEQLNNENKSLNVLEKVVNGFANKKENLKITEEEFSKFMYRPEIPDPELVIRTSGEFRISNFLLWEVAYSEFYITDVYWPDFDENELDKAILSFNKRDRRYGGLNVK